MSAGGGGVTDAWAFAVVAHEGQTDKAGEPYIEHVLRVWRAVPFTCAVAAFLHDVVEDTAFTLADLAERFDPADVAAVDALTRRGGETYNAYIERVAANPVARVVKLADLADNLDPARVAAAEANGHDVSRLRARYERARARLAQEAADA